MADAQAPHADEFRTVVPTPVEAKPLFVWEAVVRFSTTYDLPNNVLEAAVLRAIANADIAKVDSLRPSLFGRTDAPPLHLQAQANREWMEAEDA